MKNILILFTAEFPFGKGETFLETEIDYLSKGFDKVIIITRGIADSSTRSVPQNVKLVRVKAELSPLGRLRSLFNVFDFKFRKELKIIRSVYQIKVSLGILKTMLISLQEGKRFQKLLRKELVQLSSNDRIVAYSYWCDDTALACAMEKRINNKFTAVTRIHGWDLYFERSSIGYLPFRHFIAENMNKIVSISDNGKNYCRDTWRVNSTENIIVSRLGVPKQGILNRENQVFLLVTCSNLIPLKRLGLLIEALSKVKERKMKWVHFGDGKLFSKLKDQALDSLPENVEWKFMGRIENRSLLDWYRNNKPNLFLNLSSSEGVPVSIMEAMSFGIPVIATDVGGNSEIVNNKNGYLLDANPSSEDVSNKITKYYNLDLEEKNKYRKAAYYTWNEMSNADKNYTQFIEAILAL